MKDRIAFMQSEIEKHKKSYSLKLKECDDQRIRLIQSTSSDHIIEDQEKKIIMFSSEIERLRTKLGDNAKIIDEHKHKSHKVEALEHYITTLRAEIASLSVLFNINIIFRLSIKNFWMI